MKVAELDFSKVDNKTKLETMLQEEAAIRQENKERELERLAETAEKAKEQVGAPVNYFKFATVNYSLSSLNSFI